MKTPSLVGWTVFLCAAIAQTALGSEPSGVPAASSGGGGIRMLPSAFPYSVKNGEKLTLRVIVSAPAGVAAVQADLGGIETLALTPTSSVSKDSDGNLISGLWEAEWTGHDLQEKIYDITVRVQDRAEHSVTDKSLHFSDPAAGLSTPGTAAAPTSGIRELRSDNIFHDQDSPTFCACYDAAQGEALFGTFTNPSQIIKVKVNGANGVPERIGRITLNTGEDFVHSACYDSTTKIALFGAAPSLPNPGIIVKIAMGAAGQLPVRVGAVTLNTGETSPYSCVYDPVSQVALFGTLTSPSNIVKVAMNAPADAPTRVGAITLPALEGQIRTGIIDPATGIALFANDNTSPGSVVKINVNGPNGPPVRVNSVILNSDDNGFQSSAYDAANNVGLFAMHPNPANPGSTPKLIKIAFNGPTEAPTRVASLDLNAGEDIGQMSQVVNGSVLLATDVAPSTIIKCSIGNAAAAPTRSGAVTLNANEQRASSVMTDAADNVGLFGCAPAGRIAPVITKVSFGTLPADPPARVSALALFVNESGTFCAVYDPVSKRGLFVSNGAFASNVIKVAFDSPDGIPRRVGAVQLNDGETSIMSAVLDAANGIALLPTSTTPARAVKVALGAAEDPPTRIGAVTLNTGENSVQSCVLDAASGIALLGTTTNPAIVAKVALNAPGAAPTRVGAVTLNAGERGLVSAVADPANGVALFGSSASTGTVVKVAFGLPADPPTRVGVLTLTAAEGAYYAAVIDLAHNVALFQADQSPNVIVKVALNNPADAPTKVSSTTLAAGENGANGAAFDPVTGTAFFATFSSPSHIVAVAAGLAADAPARLSGTTLKSGENIVSAVIVDPSTSLAFASNPSAPTKVITLPYSPRNTINATKINLPDTARVTDLRFYSHAAAGNLRLAIYDNSVDKKLLWQTASISNTAANAEVVVPISSGTPASLALTPGTYYLAWQTDTVTPVASFTAGTAGDGFSAIQSFGAYPATITAAAQTATADRYTEYITYSLATPSALSADPSVAGLKQLVHFNMVETVLDPQFTFTYMWDFGDGNSATGQSPTHRYAAAGSYSVSVTVSDGNGGSDTKTTTVTVVDPFITVSADPSEAFTAVPVNFDASAFFYTGSTVTYAWTFGDGGTDTGPSPVHTYSASGNYTAGVTATDSAGGATATGSIIIHVTTVPIVLTSGPVASANPAGVGQQITFTASASAAPGLTITYTWDFGDGSPTATGASVMHTYAAPSDYTVKVTAADGTGSTAVNQIILSVLGPVIGSGSLDTDGDGFSDGFETDNATLPTSAASTPFDNASAIVFTALTIVKPSIGLNFKKSNSDSVKFSGTLDIPDNFNGSGQHFYVVVGDNLVKFTLDSKLSSKSAAGSVKLTIKFKKGLPITHQTGKYAVSLSKGAFAAKLAPYGLTGAADIKIPASRTVPFALFFNGQTLQKRVVMLYTAKVGSSGKASAK